MAISLYFMGSSADRSAADVALPVCAGETQVQCDTPGTSTTFKTTQPGAIVGAFTNSETAAMVECRFHKNTDVNYNKVVATHLQTDPLRTNSITHLNYPVLTTDPIEASGENAGAVMDLLGLLFAKSPADVVPSPVRPANLPPCMNVRATSTFTHVADTVAEGTLVFDDFVPDEKASYKILGLAAHSATGLATRLRFVAGPNMSDVPGVPMADTSTGLEYMMLYGDFGTFPGANLPRVQSVAVDADAVTVMHMLLTRVK